MVFCRNGKKVTKNKIFIIACFNRNLWIWIDREISGKQSMGSIFYVIQWKNSECYIFGWMDSIFLILTGMCLKERFFCQYLCPMGGIFSWMPVFPVSVLDRNREQCIPKCRACQMRCPVDLEIQREQKNSGECIHCMQCTDVCPKQHIHFGIGKKWRGNEVAFVLMKTVCFIMICLLAENL